MAIQIVFEKNSHGKGSRMLGKLSWLGDKFDAISGGYGKGPIPDGMYDIEIYHTVVGTSNSMRSGFVNPITGRGWFIPLKPKFATTRHGFGIHPDGNLPGTKGYVGLQGGDIKRFWDKWSKTPMNTRPTMLLVATIRKKS